MLDLEGLWTRYDDPEPLLAEVDRAGRARRPPGGCRRSTPSPSPRTSSAAGSRRSRAAGVTTAASLSPQRTARYAKAVVDAGVDIFVIRGTTVSAEHVSGRAEPLNLKQFIYELDVPVIVGGCATYTAALHLMRTGAAGVLVGFGGGSGHTTAEVLGVAVPMATAIADVAAARRDYLDESGGRYVHVIADGGDDQQRRHRQGAGHRRGRGHGGLPVRPGRRGAGPRLPLGQRGQPHRTAPRRPGQRRHDRHAGADPARPVDRRRTAR